MRITRASMIVIPAVLFLARVADSQTSPVFMSVSGGGAMPVGDFGDLANTGFALGGSAEFNAWALPFAVRIDIGYTKFGEKDFSFSDGTETILVEFGVSNFSGSLNAVFGPSTVAPVRPYFLGGIGFYNSTTDISFSGGGFEASGDDSHGSFGLNGGLGLRFRMGAVSTFIEGRYHYLINGMLDPDDTSDSEEPEYKSGSYIPIVFGVSFGR